MNIMKRFDHFQITAAVTVIAAFVIVLTLLSPTVAGSTEKEIEKVKVKPVPQKLIIESVAGSETVVIYRIRQGKEIRNVALHQLESVRIIVVYSQDQKILAIAAHLDAGKDKAVSSPIFIRFLKNRQADTDTFTEAIIERTFIAGLPLPDKGPDLAWKKRFEFIGASKQVVRPKSLFMKDLISYDPGRFQSLISDFFCEARCLDSVCAACMNALCDYFECLEDIGRDIESNPEIPIPESRWHECEEHGREALLRCGGQVD